MEVNGTKDQVSGPPSYLIMALPLDSSDLWESGSNSARRRRRRPNSGGQARAFGAVVRVESTESGRSTT